MHDLALFPIFLRVLPCALFPLVLAASAVAAPYIEHLYPAGGSAGQTLEVTLGGKALDGARAVWVSGTGVTGEVLTVNEPTRAQIAAARERDEVASQSARLRLKIAPDAVRGVRDLRIMARAGLSNRFRFEIGHLREVLEKEPNNSHDAAQVLPPLPVTVNGQINNADLDFFRFSASAGQHLLLQVQARSIKPFLADAVPGWFQSRLALYEVAGGKKIAEVDDFRGAPDPVLLWTVPVSGEYIVCIWDALSRGREDFVYRLNIGQLPFITDVFPLGAPAGRISVTARGINLGPGSRLIPAPFPKNVPVPDWCRASLTSARLNLDFSKVSTGLTTVKAAVGSGETNSLPFEIGTLPELFEKDEPNDLPRNSQRISPPVVVNGRIDYPDDTDCYTFFAKEGERFVIDVMARRLDSPLDAHLRVMPPKLPTDSSSLLPAKRQGKVAKEASPVPSAVPWYSDDVKDKRFDLLTHHADPRIQFTAPTTGQYQVFIKDMQGQGGAEYAYRLRIAPPQPDYQLRVMPDNLTVPAGGNVVVQLRAFRIDGFDNAMDLYLEGLPSGFELGAASIPARKDSGIFTLHVPATAKPGVYQPRFFAEADVPQLARVASKKLPPTRRVRHSVDTAEELMQAFFYTHTVPVAQGYLVVTEAAPFSVEVDVGKLSKPGKTKSVGPEARRAGVSKKNKALDPIVLEIPLRTDVSIPVRIIPGKEPLQDKGSITITATRVGPGVEVTPAILKAGETSSNVVIRCEQPARKGEEGVFIIEAVQRTKKGRIRVIAPALRFRITEEGTAGKKQGAQ